MWHRMSQPVKDIVCFVFRRSTDCAVEALSYPPSHLREGPANLGRPAARDASLWCWNGNRVVRAKGLGTC